MPMHGQKWSSGAWVTFSEGPKKGNLFEWRRILLWVANGDFNESSTGPCIQMPHEARSTTGNKEEASITSQPLKHTGEENIESDWNTWRAVTPLLGPGEKRESHFRPMKFHRVLYPYEALVLSKKDHCSKTTNEKQKINEAVTSVILHYLGILRLFVSLNKTKTGLFGHQKSTDFSQKKTQGTSTSFEASLSAASASTFAAAPLVEQRLGCDDRSFNMSFQL